MKRPRLHNRLVNPTRDAVVAVVIVVASAWFCSPADGVYPGSFAWLPAGAMFGILVLRGLAFWPVVWMAAFTAESLGLSGLINGMRADPGMVDAFAGATGATLGAAIGAKFFGPRKADDMPLFNTQGLIRFLAYAVIAGPMVDSGLLAMLAETGAKATTAVPELWVFQALEKMAGVLVAAPVVLLYGWRQMLPARVLQNSRRLVITGGAIVLLGLLALEVGTGMSWSAGPNNDSGVLWLLVLTSPIVVTAGFVVPMTGGPIMVFFSAFAMIAGNLIWGDAAPLSNLPQVLLVQFLISVLAIQGLAVSGIQGDRHRVLRSLKQRGQILDHLVKLRARDIETSRQQLRDAIAAMPACLWQTDADLKVVYASPQAEELFGADRQGIVGQYISELCFGEPAGDDAVTNLRVAMEPDFQPICHLVTRRDGSVRYLETSPSAILDQDGNFCGVRGMSRDVTDARQAVLDAKSSMRRFRDVFDGLDLLIWVVDFRAAFDAACALRAEGITDVSRYAEDNPEWFRKILGETSVLDLNKSALSLFGVTDREALIDSIDRFISPEPPDVVLSEIAAMVAGEVSFQTQLPIYRPDGTAFSGLLTMPLPTNRLQASHLPVALADVSALREAEAAVQRSRKQMEAITESAQDGIIAINQEGTVIAWNRGAARIFGYEASEIVGHSMASVMPQRYHSRHTSALRTAVQRGGVAKNPQPLRLAGLRKSGEEFPIELSLGSWCEEGQIYFSGVVRDITNRVKSEESLWQMQKVETIGGLAAGIAHDFNNLLQPIMALTELLQTEVAPESHQGELLAKVHEASVRARDLVARILSFSRKEEKDAELINLAEMLLDSVEFLRSVIPSSVQIETDIQPVGWANIAPNEIHALLMNLAINGADAMKGKPGVLTIRLSPTVATLEDAAGQPKLMAGRPCAKLEMTDTGRGMSETVKNMIFQPYFTTKSVGHGTGLGLSIVQNVVLEHGGLIRVQSEINKGTTFTILLPLQGQVTADVRERSREGENR